jgi:hypothetical protein
VAWVFDGRRVVISKTEPDKKSRLYVQNIKNGLPQPLTDENVHLLPYVSRVVSPNGRFVTTLRPDGQTALYPINSNAPSPIPNLGSDLIPLGWTDHPGVLFAHPRSDGRKHPIYQSDVATGRRQP